MSDIIKSELKVSVGTMFAFVFGLTSVIFYGTLCFANISNAVEENKNDIDKIEVFVEKQIVFNNEVDNKLIRIEDRTIHNTETLEEIKEILKGKN